MATSTTTTVKLTPDINSLSGPMFPRAPPVISSFRGEKDYLYGNKLSVKKILHNCADDDMRGKKYFNNSMSHSYDGSCFRAHTPRENQMHYIVNPEWISELSHSEDSSHKEDIHNNNNIKPVKVRSFRKLKNPSYRVEQRGKCQSVFYYGDGNGSVQSKSTNIEWPKRCKSVPANKYRNPINWLN